LIEGCRGVPWCALRCAFEAVDNFAVLAFEKERTHEYQGFQDLTNNSQFKDRRRNMDDELEYRRVSGRGSQSLTNIRKPLLAMIHGYCVGGGVGIAITCDLRIASDNARFGVPAARLGLGYHYDGIEKLMHLIGPSNGLDIYYSARTDFSAAEALRMGLVNHVVLHTAKATVRELPRPPKCAISASSIKCWRSASTAKITRKVSTPSTNSVDRSSRVSRHIEHSMPGGRDRCERRFRPRHRRRS
jgi:enoyl-CoA hydratase/carnithine racemase